MIHLVPRSAGKASTGRVALSHGGSAADGREPHGDLLYGVVTRFGLPCNLRLGSEAFWGDPETMDWRPAGGLGTMETTKPGELIGAGEREDPEDGTSLQPGSSTQHPTNRRAPKVVSIKWLMQDVDFQGTARRPDPELGI